MTSSCPATRSPDGQYRCARCKAVWDADDEAPCLEQVEVEPWRGGLVSGLSSYKLSVDNMP